MGSLNQMRGPAACALEAMLDWLLLQPTLQAPGPSLAGDPAPPRRLLLEPTGSNLTHQTAETLPN